MARKKDLGVLESEAKLLDVGANPRHRTLIAAVEEDVTRNGPDQVRGVISRPDIVDVPDHTVGGKGLVASLGSAETSCAREDCQNSRNSQAIRTFQGPQTILDRKAATIKRSESGNPHVDPVQKSPRLAAPYVGVSFLSATRTF